MSNLELFHPNTHVLTPKAIRLQEYVLSKSIIIIIINSFTAFILPECRRCCFILSLLVLARLCNPHLILQQRLTASVY